MLVARSEDSHFKFLDGFRGLLSLWVYVYHTALLSGWYTMFIPAGAQAVDIFMLLSGLLMTINFEKREAKSPLKQLRTVLDFYLRRFFRVAPVYFVALAVALSFGTKYTSFMDMVWTNFPPPWAASLANDPSSRDVTATSLLLHFSFLFGLLPQYASNNALPDWSLSLEMQFYALIPFITLAARRIGWLPVIAFALAVQVVTTHFVGLYLTPKQFGLWPQPSAIPFKIICFLTGSLIAKYALGERSVVMAVMIAVCLLSGRSTLFLLAGLTILATLSAADPANPIRILVFRVLDAKVIRFAGLISYPVYLIHTLILWPVAAALATNISYHSLPAAARFGVVILVVTIILIPVCYAVHILIERPGINLGRRLSMWRPQNRAKVA